MMLSIGRVVKHFQPHDVALVKFGHRPAAYFEGACSRIEKESVVFVAATDGYVVGKEALATVHSRPGGKLLVFPANVA